MGSFFSIDLQLMVDAKFTSSFMKESIDSNLY